MKNITYFLLVMGLLLGVSTSSALAHYVKENPIVYSTYTQCVGTWSEISHGTGKGYLKAETVSYRQAPPGVCSVPKNQPAGEMIVQPQVWQDNGASDWKCTDWGQIRNTHDDYFMRFERTFAAVPSGGSCTGTSDWYGTYVGSWVWDNGAWRGGWTFSKWHILPTSGDPNEPLEGTDAAQVPALDPWVDPETMMVDLSLVPDNRFPVPE